MFTLFFLLDAGNTTLLTTAGEAAFRDLFVDFVSDAPGYRILFNFTSRVPRRGGRIPIVLQESDYFPVIYGPPRYIRIIDQPSGAPKRVIWPTQPLVQVFDQGNNVILIGSRFSFCTSFFHVYCLLLSWSCVFPENNATLTVSMNTSITAPRKMRRFERYPLYNCTINSTGLDPSIPEEELMMTFPLCSTCQRFDDSVAVFVVNRTRSKMRGVTTT